MMVRHHSFWLQVEPAVQWNSETANFEYIDGFHCFMFYEGDPKPADRGLGSLECYGSVRAAGSDEPTVFSTEREAVQAGVVISERAAGYV